MGVGVGGCRYCNSETRNNNFTLSGMVHLLHQWHQFVHQNTTQWIVNYHFMFQTKLLYRKPSQICNALSSRSLVICYRKQPDPNNTRKNHELVTRRQQVNKNTTFYSDS